MDDLAKLATGALGAIKGAKGEVDTLVKARMERLAAQLDLVPREEFEVVRAMAIQAREENEALSARLAALEAQLNPVAASGPAIVPQAPQPPEFEPAAEAGTAPPEAEAPNPT
ncbi:accessory factor UbiK family protein [Zavarzinia sp. CC-PAN008]|uniref:accessory factor UbiK family protein n=1 Tax=Zavarzinia sp. CC-PAN008 TaxID=3243332 RepID=UPI003F749BB8